jgi:hypothetical protein
MLFFSYYILFFSLQRRRRERKLKTEKSNILFSFLFFFLHFFCYNLKYKINRLDLQFFHFFFVRSPSRSFLVIILLHDIIIIKNYYREQTNKHKKY